MEESAIGNKDRSCCSFREAAKISVIIGFFTDSLIAHTRCFYDQDYLAHHLNALLSCSVSVTIIPLYLVTSFPGLQLPGVDWPVARLVLGTPLQTTVAIAWASLSLRRSRRLGWPSTS